MPGTSHQQLLSVGSHLLESSYHYKTCPKKKGTGLPDIFNYLLYITSEPVMVPSGYLHYANIT